MLNGFPDTLPFAYPEMMRKGGIIQVTGFKSLTSGSGLRIFHQRSVRATLSGDREPLTFFSGEADPDQDRRQTVAALPGKRVPTGRQQEAAA